MVAYLDDWLVFGEHIPMPEVLQEQASLGLTINFENSIINPCQRLIYLALNIDLQ